MINCSCCSKFVFYIFTTFEGAYLVAQSGEKSFECLLPAHSINPYNTVLTLDFKNETLTLSSNPVRTAFYVALRVVLTLLIEGVIFFAFGYRHRASWIAFIIINLITQGMLNAALTGPDVGVYWLLAFILYEMLIFVVEMIAFPVALRERKKLRAVVYAFTANAVSFILGALMIGILPI